MIFTQNSQLHSDLLKLALGAGHLTDVVSIIVTGHFGEPQISAANQSHTVGIVLCGRITCSLGTVYIWYINVFNFKKSFSKR